MRKVSDNNFYKFGFQDDGFIHYEEYELNGDDFENEFPDDFE